ncbi:hypothetical protein OIU77_002428 [Salix suchowensis]|uniref:Uncharacterized protein n=1 Tax=Salix suchowensis TaxID=1278906 RepID=A0ABQ9B6H4_9ROSI|nr:hypothetical protein OIU77_002428 [Salix suchowensis]
MCMHKKYQVLASPASSPSLFLDLVQKTLMKQAPPFLKNPR